MSKHITDGMSQQDKENYRNYMLACAGVAALGIALANTTTNENRKGSLAIAAMVLVGEATEATPERIAHFGECFDDCIVETELVNLLDMINR